MYIKKTPTKEINIRTDQPKTEKILVRVSKETKEDFKKALIKNDENQSSLLRAFIKDYIEKSK